MGQEQYSGRRWVPPKGQKVLRGLFEFSMVGKSKPACAAQDAVTNLPSVTSSCKNEVLGPWENCYLQTAPKSYTRFWYAACKVRIFWLPVIPNNCHYFPSHWETDVLYRNLYESLWTVIFSCKSLAAGSPGGWSKPSWHHVHSLRCPNTPP